MVDYCYYLLPGNLRDYRTPFTTVSLECGSYLIPIQILNVKDEAKVHATFT